MDDDAVRKDEAQLPELTEIAPEADEAPVAAKLPPLEDAAPEKATATPVEYPELKKSEPQAAADTPSLPPQPPQAISFRPSSQPVAPHQSTARMVPEADLKPYATDAAADGGMQAGDTTFDPVHVVGTMDLPEPPKTRYEQSREKIRERVSQKPASNKLLPDEGNGMYQPAPEPEDAPELPSPYTPPGEQVPEPRLAQTPAPEQVPDLPEPGKGKPRANDQPDVTGGNNGNTSGGEQAGQVVEKLDRMVELLQTISDKLEEIKNKETTATFA